MTRSWSNETKHRDPSVSTGWLTTWHLSNSWVSQMKEGHPRKHELEAGTVTYGIKSSDGVVAAGMYQCARQQLEREWLILGKRGGHLRSRTLRNDSLTAEATTVLHRMYACSLNSCVHAVSGDIWEREDLLNRWELSKDLKEVRELTMQIPAGRRRTSTKPIPVMLEVRRLVWLEWSEQGRRL